MRQIHRPAIAIRSVRAAAGFTLLELAVVIVLLGVLAVVALPRISDGLFRSSAFAEQVAAALRYAQRLAVATGCDIQVEVSSATHSYAVLRRAGGSNTACGPTGAAFTVAVPNPSGGSFAATASGGVQVTQGLTVFFDAQGLPQPGGGTAVVGGHSIVVEAQTGHVR